VSSVTARAERDRVYPIAYRSPTLLERLAVGLGAFGPFFCPVCGRLAVARVPQADFRESCVCSSCGATTRQRQVAYVARLALREQTGRAVSSLRAARPLLDGHLVVYNAEASGAVHRALAGSPGYRSSEYFGPEHRSGELVDGVMHQDLTRLSFEDASVSLVLSSDVLEHVPDPYKAHADIHRVLRPGGRHVFTVPFYQTRYEDEPRAVVEADGRVRHLHEALYHGDPVRPNEGILVYTIFALEMLVRLSRIGFQTVLYRIYRPGNGILGNNGIVFDAVKV
jgi:SAM-dependent methyltransferase